MPLISENQALIFFAIILIVAAVIAWWMGNYNKYDQGAFHTFIAILVGFGVFVTFLFYYNLILVQNQQQKLASLEELARLNDSVLNNVLDEIKNASAIIPNFVLSISPLTNSICCGETGSTCSIAIDPVTPETCTEKMVLSYRIFSLWQDFIMSHKFMHLEALPYVSNFLQRANSQQLYSQWTVTHMNFSEITQNFGDLLFEYALPITDQTAQKYVTEAKKLIEDPRYHEIFQK